MSEYDVETFLQDHRATTTGSRHVLESQILGRDDVEPQLKVV